MNAEEKTVTQPPGDVTATEGEQVTLGCQFETSVTTNLNLFWYKYEANYFPKFMLGRFSIGGINATGYEERFDAHLVKDSRSVPLTIQRLQLSDSAVYYCTLRPTVTTGYTAPLQKLFDSVMYSKPLRDPGVS
uniref:Ig-like domain-containing protein n=1 Tax=Hucho hucho TaxID=62062 RepID=A0A4W5LLX9_9TELE